MPTWPAGTGRGSNPFDETFAADPPGGCCSAAQETGSGIARIPGREGKRMRGVSIIGIGTTPFGVLEGLGLKAMAIQAANQALADAGLDRKEIEALYVGNFISGVLTGQETIAPPIGGLLGGGKGIPCTHGGGAGGV